MRKRLRTPLALVEKDYDDICFHVDVDYTFVQVFIPKLRWLRLLGYEINVDEAFAAIIALLVEEVDKTTKVFGNYEMVNSKITMQLKIASSLKEKEMIVKKLKDKFGESFKEEKEEEEDDEEEETNI